MCAIGIEILPEGRRRQLLLGAFEMMRERIGGRIAPFDAEAAQHAAALMAARKSAGRPGEQRDTMIAGIALARHATLATRNARHFANLSVPVIDPSSG
jgi:hypothetical protein